MKLLNIPIEPIPERYSTQWSEWFITEFRRGEIDWYTIHGGWTAERPIKEGAFLDVRDTIEYKTQQQKELVHLVGNYRANDPLVLFFHDLWHPAIAPIAYLRDGLDLNIRICGCLHAGTYDPHDFLYRAGMAPWGEHLENSWFKIVDAVFVATHFHKNLVTTYREIPSEKVYVTGFPLYHMVLPYYNEPIEKENIIVFPHRLDPEKQPQLFKELEKQVKLDGWEFIRTKDVFTTKDDYYRLLRKSKIAVSFALQETWGIAMQEAVQLGCIPLVPDRLSYSEMYLDEFIYEDFEDLRIKLKFFTTQFSESLLQRQQQKLSVAATRAIPNMINIMHTL